MLVFYTSQCVSQTEDPRLGDVMPTLEELKEMSCKQKEAFKELLATMPDGDSALKLITINTAANTFYEYLIELLSQPKP